ncbi:NADH-quinone oxidoreductase subunit C [bacterium]|nr:NADH-quinone oxidoreductase subunit C [bacterium]
MNDNILTPEQVVEQFQQCLGDGLQASRIVKRSEGLKSAESIQIWLTIDKTKIKIAVQQLCDIQYPHLSVISGCDMGEGIELLYHFFIYYGVARGEYSVTIRTTLPKTDLIIDTITDLIPGALTSEREKQEFFGLQVLNIPDSRRMFLPDDFPEGVYPWRKDETGIKEEMVKKLHEVGKAEGAQRRAKNK